MSLEQFFRSRMVNVLGARPPPGLPYLVARLLEHLLISGVLPQDEILDNAEEPLTFLLLRFLSREEVRTTRRIVHHLRKDHRPSSSQRPARPPQEQRTRVPVADGLLPRRGLVDSLKREGNRNEFFAVLVTDHSI